MPIFRCSNESCSTDPHGRTIFDFELPAGAPPICPKCQADPRKPEFKHTIVKLAVIHFHIKDAKGPDIGRGSRYRIACGGTLSGKMGTAAHQAVTCPECKKSAEFLAVTDEYAPLAEKDFQVTVDLEKQQLVAGDGCCP